MLWNEMYSDEHEPSENEVAEFIKSPLWGDLANHLQQTYNVKPKLSYSNCAMDGGNRKGWNVKYAKNGKSLCTLYPKEGHFLALVTIGAKEISEADLLIPLCGEYVQGLYCKSKSSTGGKSPAIEVTSGDVLEDMKNLIAVRATKK